MSDKPKCKAHKKDGTPCGRWPVKGATVCPKHGGSAPQVRRKAQERLLAAADSLMAQLLKIATSAESESVRLAAIRDALDRAGFAPAQLVKLGIGNEDPWGDMLAELMTDEVLEPVDRRALPARRGGGVVERDWDAEDAADRAVARVEVEYDPDDDVTAEDLTYDTPGTIRGEVVRSSRNAEPRVPARIREGLGLPAASGVSWSR